MKKLLALVLALVMTLSLCTISNAAYSDAADVDYKEAVDVMTAAGVFNGADGKFNPKDILTREQAAKIVTYMLLGKKSADALVTIAAPFADVAADRWSAGSIAYCYNEGILAGVGNGMFAPASQLTGLAFAKMMLTALGYSAENEGLTGSNWSINTAKLALTVGLTDDLDDVALSAPMTREQAAKMALNTELATMVEYPNASTIKVGNVEVTTSAKASDVYAANADTFNSSETSGGKYTLQFAEKYAKKLDNESTTDKFGRPATKWTWDGESVGTYADKAAKTITLAKAKNVKTVLTNADYLDYDNDDILPTAKLWQNGVNTKAGYGTFDTEVTLGIGDIVETFEDKNGDVTDVVVRTYTAVEINTVKTSVGASYAAKGASYAITFNQVNNQAKPVVTLYDAYKGDATKVLQGFDAATYTNKTVIAVALKNGNDNVVLDSYIPKCVTGKVTNYKQNDFAYVDGAKYTFATPVSVDLTAFGFDYDINIYLDKAGYVIGTSDVGTDKLENVYYVTGVYAKSGAIESATTTYYAQAVKLDGTVETIKLEEAEFVKILAAKNTLSGTGFDVSNYAFNGGYLYIKFAATAANWEANKANLYIEGTYAGQGAADFVGGKTYYQRTAVANNTFYPYDFLTAFADTDNNGKSTFNEYSGGDTFAYAKGTMDGTDITTKSTHVNFGGATATVGDAAGYTTVTRKYFTDDTQFLAVKNSGDNLKVTAKTGKMTMDASTTTGLIVIYKDKSTEASYVIYVGGSTMTTATSTADMIYVAKNTSAKQTIKVGVSAWYNGDIYYMDGNAKTSMYLASDYAAGFYTIASTTENGIVTLTGPVADEVGGTAIDSAKTGCDSGISITGNYGQALQATNYDDITFEGATVIDVRLPDNAAVQAYTDAVDSPEALVAAIGAAEDLGGDVTADVYVTDGKVTFVCVKAVATRLYAITPAVLVDEPAGTTIVTTQANAMDGDIIDIYVYIPAGVAIANDTATLTGTNVTAISAPQTVAVDGSGDSVAQTLHFTAQVNGGAVTGLTVTFA